MRDDINLYEYINDLLDSFNDYYHYEHNLNDPPCDYDDEAADYDLDDSSACR